jgi:hypothetical protein
MVNDRKAAVDGDTIVLDDRAATYRIVARYA